MTAQAILASGSATRAEMLRRAGVAIEIAPPRIDEAEVKLSLRAAGASPREQADALAEMKAVRVSARRRGSLVIGADQVLDFGGEALDKPESAAAARATLLRLRGGRHELFSGAVIALDGAPIWRHVGRARLTMRRFSDEFIDDYLAKMGENALSAVGCYQIEEAGAQLFARVEGDWFTILGLPLLEVLEFLRVRGVLPE